MASQAGGYALIHRQIFDNPAFDGPWEAMAFAYLIINAAWKPTRVRYKGRECILERGQLTLSTRDFAKAMNKPTTWAHRFLVRLEQGGMIEKKVKHLRNSGGTAGETPPAVITICNYDKYQVVSGRGETPLETPPGTPPGTQNNKEKERNTKKERVKGDVPLPEWLPVEAWSEFLAMRRSLKKPATPFAQRKLLDKLERMRRKGLNPQRIIERSVVNCWQDFYEPNGKDEAEYRSQPRLTL